MSEQSIDVFDPVDESLYKPQIPEIELQRDGLLATLESYCNKRKRFIIVDGDQGVGKTVLLSQFVRQWKKDAIALFIDPINKNSYREENLLIDLYIQVSIYIDQPASAADFTNQKLLSAFQSLQYLINQKKNNFYIVIDGLDEIPDDSIDVAKKIYNLLPTACQYIKCIFSLSSGPIVDLIPLNHKETLTVSHLSKDEGAQLIPSLDEEKISHLMDLFPRLPSVLFQIRRMLASEISFEKLISDGGDIVEDLYQLEWSLKSEIIHRYEKILSTLAFSENNLSIKDISKLCKVDNQEVTASVSSLNFISEDGGYLNYISSGVKVFAASFFSSKQHDVRKNIVQYLQEEKGDIDSLSSITGYLSKIGDNSEVIHHLNNEHLKEVVEQTLSYSEMVKQINYGIAASTASNSENDMLRFSHLKSFVTDSKIGKASTSELLAYLKVGDLKSSIDLASNARSVEEKIQLFSKIANHQAEQGQLISEVIKNEVEMLYAKIKPEFIGVEQTIDIAIDLFSVFPDISLNLINGIDELNSGGGNRSDYAFIRFSLGVAQSSSQNMMALEEKTSTLGEKKKEFFSTLSLFKRGTPAKKIIDKIHSMEEAPTGEKLFMLRNWIRAFPDMNDNHMLVEEAIALAVGTTEFSANAGFYYDMAAPMEYMPEDIANEIFKKIDIQIDSLRNMGPTIDYANLVIELHRHEVRVGRKTSRIDDLYQYLSFRLEDKAIALAALSALSKYVYDKEIKRYSNDIKAAKNELFKTVISKTANQYEILKPAIQIEAEVDYRNSLSWSDSLNIQIRRDEARCLAIKTHCESVKNVDISYTCQEIKKIVTYTLRRASYIALLNNCLDRNDVTSSQFDKLKKTKNSISEGLSPCLIFSKLIEIGVKNNCISDHKLQNMRDELSKYLEKIDETWRRSDAGFQIHNRLVSIDEEFADNLKSKSVALSEEYGNEKESVANGLYSTLDLAFRAFKPMVNQNIDTEDEREDLIEAIKLIPGKIYRVKGFSRLASVFQLNNRNEISSQIIEKYLIPLIDSSGDSQGLHKACLGWSMPVLYRYSPAVFEGYLSKYRDDQNYTDGLISGAIDYIYKKVMIGDPFEAVKNYNYALVFKDIKEILSLIKYMQVAPYAFSEIVRLSEECFKGIRNNKISNDQKNVISSELEEIIESKIRDSDFIKHEGYYICSIACLYRVKQIKKKSIWKDLTLRAKDIPNDSDMALILNYIAELMPTSLRPEAKGIVSEAVEIVDNLPSALDRLDRYNGICDFIGTIDKPLAKEVIKKALLLSTTDDSEEFEKRRSSLIDTAYAIDKEMPSALAAINDKDEARVNAIRESLDIKQKEREDSKNFQNDRSALIDKKLKDKSPGLAWDLLKKINGNSYVPKPRISFLQYLINIQEFSSEEVYPLLSYYIAALEEKYRNKADVRSNIRPVFSTLVANFSLLLEVYKVDYSRDRIVRVNSDNLIVGPNDEGRAVIYIQEWIEKNKLEKITIIDPYLTLDAMRFIGDCIQKDPNFELVILTGQDRLKEIKNNSDEDIDDVIYDYWTSTVNSEALPSIKIVFAGLKSKSNSMPIHDRWWLSEESGLRFGGSINGLGGFRIQEISKISAGDKMNIVEATHGLITSKQKIYNGERVKYQICQL